MSEFLKKGYRSLVPYVPGEQPQDGAYVKLNTNENPYPPCPAAAGILDGARSLRLYSDPESNDLVESIASYYDVKKKNILVTNGSDEGLAFIFCAFFDQENVVSFPDITYGFYPIFADFAGAKYEIIPLKEDFSLDLDAMKKSKNNLVFANPNAPTGIKIDLTDIRDLLTVNPARLVVVDEAYVDFGTYSCVSLIKEFRNLIVVQTFSKSRSLAGARLGVVFADEAILSDLKTVKYSFNPYNVNTMTAAVGKAAIEDADYFNTCRARVMLTRAKTEKELKKLGFSVLPSSANFLFAEHPAISGEKLYTELKKRRVLVRHFSAERIKNFVRITIGTDEQMQTFLSATAEILNEEA